MRRLTSVAAAGAAVIGLASGLAACGGGSSTSSSTSTSTTGSTTTTTTSSTTATTGGGASAASITIQNFAFKPLATTVKAGSTITVKNQDSATHTLTADNGAFDTGNISGGGTKTITAPTKPGSFSYHCTIHAFMTHGTITVTS